MAPRISKRWTTDPDYIDLLNYIIEITKNVESPMSVMRMVRKYKEKNGAAQGIECLRLRIYSLRTVIHSFGHIDTKTKVKVLFMLSAPIDAAFLKELKKDAHVEVDDKKRIIHYKANEGSLELNGDHSQLEKYKNRKIDHKRTHRSMINNYFKNKNDVIPTSKEEKEMWNLIEFITEKCENVNSPLSIRQLTEEFNNHFGISILSAVIQKRVKAYSSEIQKEDFLDTPTKVKQLFGLSATVHLDYLKKLRTEALVEIDEKNRITHYKANDGSLELRGDHSQSAKTRTGMLECKNNSRRLIKNYFENKNDVDAVPENEEEKEMAGKYCREIQKTEFLDTHSKVRQLFCLSVKLDSDCLKELRKDAVVEVDNLNRITKYTANDGRLLLHGNHSRSAKQKLDYIRRTKKKNAAKNYSNSGGDEEEDSEEEEDHSEDDSDEYSSEEFDSDFNSDEENDHLDETEDHMEPSSEADVFDNDTPVRNRSPTVMSIDDNFDFDPPTERTHRTEGTEIREDEEKENDPEITENAGRETRYGRLSKTSSSTSHTPKTSKRKDNASSESNSTKRTIPPLEEPMNSGEMNDNVSHKDPSRVELKPFRELLRLPNGVEDDSDIQQIPKPRPQVMEAPIKKEYEEEAQTSLKMVMNAFKSLILSLDTPGLSQLQIEIDKRIMEAGIRIEISNEEVILAMEFLIVKLSKHGALESSEDSISLRDILLMLRTIILNSSFNGLELILEMLKENIEQLKVLDKKVSVSKVECVLRATLDNILT